jgi:hypothetical protein
MKINTAIIIGMILFAMVSCAEKMQREADSQYTYYEAK